MTFPKSLFCVVLGLLVTSASFSYAQKDTPASEESEAAQAKEGGAAEEVKDESVKPSVKKDDKPKSTEIKKIEPAVQSQPKESVDPSLIRVHLMDSSVMSGQLTVQSITVDTDFGKLVIPVDRILNLAPGLKSHPEQQKKIGRLVQQLGSNNAKERDQAQRNLLEFGVTIRPFLTKYTKDSDTERRTRVQKILAELEEIAEDDEDNDATTKGPQLVVDDTVVTDRFTVVGEVTPKTFELKTKFGSLTVALADILEIKREIKTSEDIRKKISVPGTNIIQVAAKSTGIRIKRGDKITFAASGKIIMSPWGNNSISTPDGSSNYQWYVQNQIPGGCLVGRIGSSGKVFKVGSKLSMTAKSSGTLYLALAVNHSYARNYSYPGQYDVKVHVTPNK